MKLKLMFAWYDCWVGLFWDAKNRRLYFFPVPMFGCCLDFSKPPQRSPRPITFFEFEEGCCPRDGEPCESAGNGKQCCGEKETY